MRRHALLKPTELAQLAQLSEQHEELMQHLAAADEEGAPGSTLSPREMQIEARQLRQETLKLLAEIMRKIEQLS